MQKHGLLFAASAAAMIAVMSAPSWGADKPKAPVKAAVPSNAAAVQKAVDNPGRPQLDTYRDANLKPAEIMSFAGIKPGMAVTEINPGNGYWTRILSGIVGPKGAVYMVVPAARGGGRANGPAQIKDPNQNDPYNAMQIAHAVTDQPEFRGNLTVFSLPIAPSLNVPKQLDAIVLAGNYHTLKADFANIKTDEMDKGFFRALKSGGTYLIIDAAANKGTGFADAKLGRTDEGAVVAEVLAAGFQLEAESNVLARPGDAHTAQASDASDMYVLRFKKPANAPNSDKRPPDIKAAMAGYYGFTRRTNPGLIRPGGVGHRERRVMYHPDLTYQEYGQKGSGDNPWQSGTLYFGADGDGCMLHEFPLDQKGFVACSSGRAAPDKKPGDMWFDNGEIREFLGKGYIKFPDKEATPGGTLGNTPQEVAQGFGKYYGFAEKSNAPQGYLNEYLAAYRDFRSAQTMPAGSLDAEFTKTYGKAVPPLPPPGKPARDNQAGQD